MKTTVYIMILALIISFSSNAVCKEADTTSFTKLPKEIKKAMSTQMDFPEEASALGIEGEVVLCFVITPEGLIKINCINGHPILVAGVKKELNNMEFSKKLAFANKKMLIKYNFKKE